MAQHALCGVQGPALHLEDGGGLGTAGCGGSTDYSGLSWHHLSSADAGQHTALPAWMPGEMGQEGQPFLGAKYTGWGEAA